MQEVGLSFFSLADSNKKKYGCHKSIESEKYDTLIMIHQKTSVSIMMLLIEMKKYYRIF